MMLKSWSVAILTLWSFYLLRSVSSLVRKEFEYRGISSGAVGSIIFSKQVHSNIVCAAMCLSLDICFVYDVTNEGGTKICNLIKEIHLIKENASAMFYMDTNGYHEYHQFIPYRGYWLKLTTQGMTYASATSYCADRGLEMFVPRDQADNDRMVMTMSSGGAYFMWYPLSDVEVEGTIKWLNGSVVATTDAVPWNMGNYGSREGAFADEDCGQITYTGKVSLYWCFYQDTGVVCKSNLDQLLNNNP